MTVILKTPHDWEWEENRSIQLVEKNGWNFYEMI